jgi:hypothetical protein
MKRTLLSSLAMVLLVACGGSDSTTAPTTTTVPDTLLTWPHFETGGTWRPAGTSVSGISWRRIDMGFYGALRISYNMTFTNNDPSRAVRIGFTIHFKDANGFELAKTVGDYVTISVASSREIGGVVDLEGITTVSLANQITKMEVRAGFTFIG